MQFLHKDIFGKMWCMPSSGNSAETPCVAVAAALLLHFTPPHCPCSHLVHSLLLQFRMGCLHFAAPHLQFLVSPGAFSRLLKKASKTSRPPDSSRGGPISPQRVRKKRVMSKGTHSKKLKVGPRDHQIRVRSVRFPPRGSEKRELCRKGHIPKN